MKEERVINEFWKMLASQRLTDPDKIDTRKGVVDQEATVIIDGLFDKYGIEEWLKSRFTSKNYQ